MSKIRNWQGQQVRHLFIELSEESYGFLMKNQLQKSLDKITEAENSLYKKLNRQQMKKYKIEISNMYYIKGLILDRKKDLNKSLMAYQRAFEEYRQNKSVCNNIGKVYLQLQNHDEAEKYLLFALQLDDKLLQAYVNLAFLYFEKNELENCILICEMALKKNIHDYMLHEYLGICHAIEHKNFTESLKHLQLYMDCCKKSKFKPSFLALKHIAHSLLLNSKYSDALEYIEKAIQLYPSESDILFLRSQILYQLDKLDESEQDILNYISKFNIPIFYFDNQNDSNIICEENYSPFQLNKLNQFDQHQLKNQNDDHQNNKNSSQLVNNQLNTKNNQISFQCDENHSQNDEQLLLKNEQTSQKQKNNQQLKQNEQNKENHEIRSKSNSNVNTTSSQMKETNHSIEEDSTNFKNEKMGCEENDIQKQQSIEIDNQKQNNRFSQLKVETKFSGQKYEEQLNIYFLLGLINMKRAYLMQGKSYDVNHIYNMKKIQQKAYKMFENARQIDPQLPIIFNIGILNELMDRNDESYKILQQTLIVHFEKSNYEQYLKSDNYHVLNKILLNIFKLNYLQKYQSNLKLMLSDNVDSEQFRSKLSTDSNKNANPNAENEDSQCQSKRQYSDYQQNKKKIPLNLIKKVKEQLENQIQILQKIVLATKEEIIELIINQLNFLNKQKLTMNDNSTMPQLKITLADIEMSMIAHTPTLIQQGYTRDSYIGDENKLSGLLSSHLQSCENWKDDQVIETHQSMSSEDDSTESPISVQKKSKFDTKENPLQNQMSDTTDHNKQISQNILDVQKVSDFHQNCDMKEHVSLKIDFDSNSFECSNKKENKTQFNENDQLNDNYNQKENTYLNEDTELSENTNLIENNNLKENDECEEDGELNNEDDDNFQNKIKTSKDHTDQGDNEYVEYQDQSNKDKDEKKAMQKLRKKNKKSLNDQDNVISNEDDDNYDTKENVLKYNRLEEDKEQKQQKKREKDKEVNLKKARDVFQLQKKQNCERIQNLKLETSKKFKDEYNQEKKKLYDQIKYIQREYDDIQHKYRCIIFNNKMFTSFSPECEQCNNYPKDSECHSEKDSSITKLEDDCNSILNFKNKNLQQITSQTFTQQDKQSQKISSMQNQTNLQTKQDNNQIVKKIQQKYQKECQCDKIKANLKGFDQYLQNHQHERDFYFAFKRLIKNTFVNSRYIIDKKLFSKSNITISSLAEMSLGFIPLLQSNIMALDKDSSQTYILDNEDIADQCYFVTQLFDSIESLYNVTDELSSALSVYLSEYINQYANNVLQRIFPDLWEEKMNEVLALLKNNYEISFKIKGESYAFFILYQFFAEFSKSKDDQKRYKEKHVANRSEFMFSFIQDKVDFQILQFFGAKKYTDEEMQKHKFNLDPVKHNTNLNILSHNSSHNDANKKSFSSTTSYNSGEVNVTENNLSKNSKFKKNQAQSQMKCECQIF